MTPDQGRMFLKILGIPHAQHSGDWLVARCPLARWNHQSKSDTNPSFGLKIGGGKKAAYNCFACGSGTAHSLVDQMVMRDPQGHHYGMAYRILENEDVEVEPLPEFSEFGTEVEKFEPWPEWFLQTLPPATAHQPALDWLKGRGIQNWQVHGLLWDIKRHMVGFPFYDVYGRLAGCRGRAIIADVSGPKKHYDYRCEGRNNTKFCWYNEQVMNHMEPTIVVEGQIDCLRVQQVYPHVIANLTAMPTAQKIQKLLALPYVVFLLDDDDTGKKAAARYREMLSGQVQFRFLSLENAPVDTTVMPSKKVDPAVVDQQWLAGALKSAGLTI